jgi:hypothetical protein
VRKPPVRLDLGSSGIRTVVRVRAYIQYIDIQQRLLIMTLMLMLGAAKSAKDWILTEQFLVGRRCYGLLSFHLMA